MSSLFDLSGRVCVVTGSTRGMGRAMVERFAEHGARVVVTSCNPEQCRSVAESLCARLGADTAIACSFDLADRPTIEAPVRAALDAWGRIDVLVGNAAGLSVGNFATVPDSEFDHGFQTNVRNNAAMARAAVPAMVAQGGGSIIFVLSTVALFPSPPYLTYSLAKAALGHLARILAVDLGPSNIRTNAIVPGLIRTDGNMGFASDPAMVKRALGANPLQRMGEPDEIAGAALLLASPGGAYINGQMIVVDGGQVHQGREAARTIIEDGFSPSL